MNHGLETFVAQLPILAISLMNARSTYSILPVILIPILTLVVKYAKTLIKFFSRERIPSNYVTYRAGDNKGTGYHVDFVLELSLFLNFFHPKSIKSGVFTKYQKNQFDPVMFFTCYNGIINPDETYFCKLSLNEKYDGQTILEKIVETGFVLSKNICVKKILVNPIYISIDAVSEKTEKIGLDYKVSENVSKKHANISAVEIEIAQFFVNLVINFNIYNKMNIKNFKLEKNVYFQDEKHGDYDVIRSNVNVIKKFDNVFLSEDNREKVINTIGTWTKDKFSHLEMGIPNKLGFLLIGSPGCGKTSLVYAIANETKKHIASFNLQDFSNKTFIRAMSRIENSVVVFDDIDSHDFTHRRSIKKNITNVTSNVISSTVQTNNVSTVQTNNVETSLFIKKITLDVMLEILDGYNYLNNCIVIMTTNNPDILDEALIRPGRMDHVINFGMCNEYQFDNMFKYYTGKSYKKINKKFIFKENIYSTSYLINTIILPNKNNPTKILELI